MIDELCSFPIELEKCVAVHAQPARLRQQIGEDQGNMGRHVLGSDHTLGQSSATTPAYTAKPNARVAPAA